MKRIHVFRTALSAVAGFVLVLAALESTLISAAEPYGATRELTIEKRYLLLPVKRGAPRRRMTVLLEGKVYREFEIELSAENPDFWAFLDLADIRGKEAMLHLQPAADSDLNAVRQDDQPADPGTAYKEKLRPQFHFSPLRGWNNDPIGLVYYRGEYHLFFQHNPYGWDWGNMHWGHAISSDLVHWKQLPIALYPHTFGDWCFSGSAVVDKENTAGFKTGADDVIVAAYTSTGRGECIAFSNDRGRTFSDYAENPVVRHNGRDPKMIWYAPGKTWVMAVYDESDGKHSIAFHTSADLKHWTFQSRIEGFFECPELFELPVTRKPEQRKWVIYGGDGDYSIGRFDGKEFQVESGKHRFNRGNYFYASQTFNDIPTNDGRRIQIAWGRVTMPGMPFNQMMLFPNELTLRDTSEGVRMFAEPVKEIERLYASSFTRRDQPLASAQSTVADIRGELLDIRADLEIGSAQELGLVVRGIAVRYDVGKKELTADKSAAPLSPQEGRIRLRILVDRTSLEIYANDGLVYMPIGVMPSADSKSVEVYARGGAARIKLLEVHELNSAWN
jgi:fructan beta-fructosidase